MTQVGFRIDADWMALAGLTGINLKTFSGRSGHSEGPCHTELSGRHSGSSFKSSNASGDET